MLIGVFCDDGYHSAFDASIGNDQPIFGQYFIHFSTVDAQLLVVADIEHPFAADFSVKHVVDVDDVVPVIEEAGEDLLVVRPDRHESFRALWHVIYVIANGIDECPTGSQCLRDVNQYGIDRFPVRQVNECISHADNEIDGLRQVLPKFGDVRTQPANRQGTGMLRQGN